MHHESFLERYVNRDEGRNKKKEKKCAKRVMPVVRPFTFYFDYRTHMNTNNIIDMMERILSRTIVSRALHSHVIMRAELH